jgi:glucosylceramidase
VGATGAGGTGATGVGGRGPTNSGGTGATVAGGATGIGGAGATTAAGGRTAGGSGNVGGISGSSTGGVGSSSTGGTTVTEPKLITSAANAYWKTDGTISEVTSGTVDVTVNDGSALQNWDGFGGTFNEKGWEVLALLTATERDDAIKLLFDAQNGARFAYGRVPIGASDYAVSRYTLAETANDTSMASFSIARDKEKLIPYIKAALAVKSDIHLWASPWSPPAWMKDNNAIDGGNMKDDAAILKAHALYLAKFVEEYKKENITIEAVHPQNEPGYETRYPSCLWTAALMTKFIGTYLGPTFADRGLTAQIYLGTMSNAEAGKDGTILSTVLGDATASKYVKGIGLQWNMIDSVSGLKSRGLPIVQTEHKCGNYPWNPAGFPTFNPDTAANDHAYGVESWGYIRDWVKAGVTSYSAWNMVLDTAGKNLDPQRPWPQNALLTVNTTTKKLNITPAYYVFRHVSQYVDPGAKVVGTTGGDAVAFKNSDGTIVAVIYNSGAAKTSIVSIGGKKLSFAMPANGWATINWK